jgi:hypothetical protein
MKKFFAHTLTLISGFAILALAAIAYVEPDWMPQWFKDHDVKLLITMISTGTAIITASLLFRSKDRETKKNAVKLKKSNRNIIIQDNSGSININSNKNKQNGSD